MELPQDSSRVLFVVRVQIANRDKKGATTMKRERRIRQEDEAERRAINPFLTQVSRPPVGAGFPFQVCSSFFSMLPGHKSSERMVIPRMLLQKNKSNIRCRHAEEAYPCAFCEGFPEQGNTSRVTRNVSPAHQAALLLLATSDRVIA